MLGFQWQNFVDWYSGSDNVRSGRLALSDVIGIVETL
jgi:hypothetical protein